MNNNKKKLCIHNNKQKLSLESINKLLIIYNCYIKFQYLLLIVILKILASFDKIEDYCSTKGAKEMSHSRLLSLVIALLTLQILLIPTASIAEVQEPILILFDNNHSQYFNSTYFQLAFESIENLNDRYQIVINTGELNSTTLIGVDAIIFSNLDAGIQGEERISIGDWLEEGNKGIFMLSNPYNSENDSLSGSPTYFNDFLQSNSLIDGLSGINPVSDLKFSENRLINQDIVEKEQFEIQTYFDNETTILNFEDSKVNSIYYYGASITAKQKIAQAGFKIYAKDKNDYVSLTTENPTVVGSVTTDQDNRLVICGSSIMFSDNINEDLETQWFNSLDNSKLWNNIVSWITFSETFATVDNELTYENYLMLGTLIIFGVVLLPTGWVFYTKGTASEKIKVKEIVSPITETKPEKTKLSKTEKRLQQRTKSK